MKKLLGVIVSVGITFGLVFFVLATPIVVTSDAILGEFAQHVGGELIEVFTIIPSGFCPAHYDLRPSDIRAVSQAVLVISVGHEQWMTSLIESIHTSDHPVSTLQVPGPQKRLDRAAEMADEIAAALSEVFPDHAATFVSNAEAFKLKLATLATALKAQAEELGIETVNVISMKWQALFVSWLGFDVVATYGMPEDLSLQDLVELKKIGEENDVVLVIDNLQSGVTFGAKLAREIGAMHAVLTGYPGPLPGTTTYLEMLETNAKMLFSALEPFQ